MHAKKICKVMDMALETGSPVIGINDAAGRGSRKRSTA
jgi:acetyl-CoA carboxylase carboxyltransferase component